MARPPLWLALPCCLGPLHQCCPPQFQRCHPSPNPGHCSWKTHHGSWKLFPHAHPNCPSICVLRDRGSANLSGSLQMNAICLHCLFTFPACENIPSEEHPPCPPASQSHTFLPSLSHCPSHLPLNHLACDNLEHWPGGSQRALQPLFHLTHHGHLADRALISP